MWASVGQILTVVILISNLIVKYGSGIAISLVFKTTTWKIYFDFVVVGKNRFLASVRFLDCRVCCYSF